MFCLDEIRNTVISGDAFDMTKKIPDESVDCILFSPPYWLQRTYGAGRIWHNNPDCSHDFKEIFSYKMHKDSKVSGRENLITWEQCTKCLAERGEFGHEPTPIGYLQHFRILLVELKRILKPSGGLWIEIYDKYIPSGLPMKEHFKPMSKACIPERLAIMLSEMEMYYRNDIVIKYTTQRPESVKNRFSRKHSFLYWFTKSPSYYFDIDSVKVPGTTVNYKNPGDIWILNPNRNKSNTASYSPELVSRVIKANCPENGIVMDPFSGMGSTIFTAKLLNRNYIGIELAEDSYKFSVNLLNSIDDNLI